MRKISLFILAVLCLTACQPIQHPLLMTQPLLTPTPHPPLTCDQILGIEIRSLWGESVEQDQLFQWIEEIFEVERTQMEVLDLNQPPNPMDKWFVTWRGANITYEITVSKNIVDRIRIVYSQEAVTVQEVIDCIGQMPEFYFAEYTLVQPAEVRPYYQSMFRMLFTELGMFSGVWPEQNTQPFSPQVNGSSHISSIAYVKPGTPVEVYNRTFGFPDNHRVYPQPQPWPGSWDEIQFVDTTTD